tara:strand:+ start:162 stop:848 length:687 start_codon:yes stop_codon:yes gene_type:complete
MRVAIIPARIGSKRILRKNIKKFAGKPIIYYSIEAALLSKLFDHVIVSTDDQEIARIAKKCGAEVPFIRPYDLANDTALTSDVVIHSIKWALNNDWDIKEVCCIYATAPFIEIDNIKEGQKMLSTGLWSYVFSATVFSSSIYRSFQLNNKGGVEMLYPEYFSTRSQDLPDTFHDAGQFYWADKDTWLSNQIFFNKNAYPIIIPNWRTHDIDTLDDWKKAELIWSALYE